MGASLALDATINNVKKDKQTYQIPIPRVTVYDVELKQKDGFTIEAFNKMLRRRGNLVQLNNSWADGEQLRPARHGKCVDNIITVLENDDERVYTITNAEMLEYFSQVCAESIDADHKTFTASHRVDSKQKQSA